MSVENIRHKLENAQELREQNPQLHIDQKMNTIYDLILEIGDLEKKKEIEDNRMKQLDIEQEIQNKETEICMLEYEIRCMVNQFEEQSNEFVSCDTL
jgi:hypothetical protein